MAGWNKMGHCKHWNLLAITLLLSSQMVMAQSGLETNTPNKQHIPFATPQMDSSLSIADEIWPILGPKADTMASSDFLWYTKQLVKQKCASDLDCKMDTYRELMIKLERKFVLPKAIMLGKEIVRLAQANNLIDLEGRMWGTISTYYHAMGNRLQSIQALDSAIVLYKRTNYISGVIRAKVNLLEFSLSFRKGEDILKEMEDLLKEAIEAKSNQETFIRIRMVLLAYDIGRFDIMEEQVTALEKIKLSTPIRKDEFAIAIHIAMGRAQIFVANLRLDEAEQYFQRALQLCRSEPSRWLEVYNLHSLASLEIGKKNYNKAVLYLDTAYVQAKDLDLQELLQTNFELKAKLAEATGNYKNALAYIRQSNIHKNTFEARSAGFDVRSFYLEKENENLAMQKQLQTVQLDLQQKNLGYAYLLFFLALAGALLFVLGYFYQRNKKRLLATQHDLIQEQTSQLKNLDEMKSKFFANVSHELRTPLTLILGPVNTLLKDPELKVNQRKLLQAIRRSSNELKELVREILDLGKLEAGSMQLQLDATALSTFFSNYITQFDSMAQYKSIHFTLENKLEDSLIGDIDQIKCRQLIYNLLTNAFKYTPSGGRIVVALVYEQQKLRFEVADSGVGIHPRDLPSVFDRYFQSTRPEKANEGGTGIGLALCKEYAQLFGGTIQVSSKLGEGSRFRVEFPVKLSASLDTESPLERLLQPVVQEQSLGLYYTHDGLAPVRHDDDKPLILVVEDNPNLQEYIQFLLTPQFSVILADNGQVALDQLATLHQQSRSCQLILSDLMMPVMDGHQLLERLKSDEATRHIPVIMLTARAEMRDKLKALRIGVDDYLSKPFVEEELLVRIDNLLITQRSRQEVQPIELDPNDPEPSLSLPDREWLEGFEAYIQDNLSGEALTVSALAQEFTMSESTLLRQLKRLTGLSPNRYLMEIRLDKARILLENRTVTSIARVAAEVGYEDTGSFSRSFKKRFGISPSSFIKS